MNYYQDKFSTLYLGDCLEELKNIEDNSIDSIVTDPPYGYSFMGKDWDKAVPSISIWKECLRVLKPGSFAFIMSSPRQDVLSRMIINLQDAGFRTDFTSIYWTYASGFPKATNISKIIDKRLGYEREVIENRKVTENMAKMSKNSPNKDGYPKQPRPKDNYWTGEILDNKSVSEKAKEFDGSYSGFQPKPAVEIIIVCMKPLSEKTFVEQALNNGHGITWLDDCRIPYENNCRLNKGGSYKGNRDGSNKKSFYQEGNGNIDYKYELPNGRFPANLLVSDDILNDGIDRKGVSGGGPKEYGGGGGFDNNLNRQPVKNYYNDSGSFSRYFDIDKWFETKIKELPISIQKVFPFLIESKASKSEKVKGLEFEKYKIGGGINGTEDMSLRTGSGNERNNLNKNNHPTVKPIKLMSYLITLGSRENDIILDPFMGSGSTGIAAKLLNRKFIGIEKEEEYIKTSKNRIEVINNQQKLI